MGRVTRSSAAGASSSRKSVEDPPAKAAPAMTKAKLEKKTNKKDGDSSNTKKQTKLTVEDLSPIAPLSSEKMVMIEACKSCGAFRTRSDKIVRGVGSKAKVEVNKEKPGKGNFVVTVSGVETPIVELRDMKRPFPALKALDMEEVIQNVLKALEGKEEK